MSNKANAPYPYFSVNGEYYDKEFLLAVEAELIKKMPIWISGLENPSICEQFAFHILKQIKADAKWGKKREVS